MNRSWLGILLLLLTGCSGKDAFGQGAAPAKVLQSVEPPKVVQGGTPNKVILVFCDVTSSLGVDEVTAGAKTAAEIIKNARPPVRYWVVPIMLRTESTATVLEDTVPTLLGADRREYPAKVAAKTKDLEKKLKDLYAEVNKGPGADPNRSCIINSLERAVSFFDQYRGKTKEFELVIISDMIEECALSPYQKTIQLNRTDIKNEIRIAQQKVNLPSLAGVRVTMVIPSDGRAYDPKSARPPVRQLAEFWKAVLSQAGLEKDVQSGERFYFGPDLPDRYRRPW